MLGSVKCPFEPQFHETAVVELNRGAAYFWCPGRISDLWSVDSETHLGKQNRCSGSWERPRRSCIADCISCISASYFCISEAGVELRPFFTKILAWTTFVHFSNPGAKNPCLDAILRDFPSWSSEIRMLLSNESLFVIRNENNPIWWDKIPMAWFVFIKTGSA